MKPENEKVHLFVWVDNHDDAYDWVKRKRFEVHPRTGAFQVWTSVDVMETPKMPIIGVFEQYTRGQLMDIGVPEEVLPVVYSIRNPDELYEYVEKIPNDVFTYQRWLAEGEPYDTVLEIAQEEQSVRQIRERSEFMNALIQSSSEVTVISSDRQLAEIMKYPFDSWRLFLHPSQKKLIESDYSGSVRVLGAAGTGKTVVALHRARKLVQDVLKPNERLLFTTYNLNLSEIIRDQLMTMCTPEEMERIDVIPIDRLARGIVENHTGITIRHLIDKEQDREEIWKQAAEKFGLDQERVRFIKGEFERFIQPEGILDKKTYLQAMRKGRKTKQEKLALKIAKDEVKNVEKEQGIKFDKEQMNVRIL